MTTHEMTTHEIASHEIASHSANGTHRDVVSITDFDLAVIPA